MLGMMSCEVLSWETDIPDCSCSSPDSTTRLDISSARDTSSACREDRDEADLGLPSNEDGSAGELAINGESVRDSGGREREFGRLEDIVDAEVGRGTSRSSERGPGSFIGEDNEGIGSSS